MFDIFPSFDDLLYTVDHIFLAVHMYPINKIQLNNNWYAVKITGINKSHT